MSWNRRLAWLAFFFLMWTVIFSLTSCAADGKVHQERIHGHDCLVRRDRVNGRVIAMSCDWDN